MQPDEVIPPRGGRLTPLPPAWIPLNETTAFRYNGDTGLILLRKGTLFHGAEKTLFCKDPHHRHLYRHGDVRASQLVLCLILFVQLRLLFCILPLNEIVMLYTMVLYGFLMILSLMVIFMILFFTIDLYFFPVEMHIMAINAFLPWILGGFTTYFFVAMIAMEPSWKFRCLYAIVVYELLDIYLLGGNMSNLYVLMIIVLVIASLGMIYTANRFKIGEK
ncbi:MAG: hypothetical protein V8R91_21325 [Butyricimonas faecihominis]